MDEGGLGKALTTLLPPHLAAEVVQDFVKLRRDCATATLERASPGKFVETFVQCLQYMATGNYDEKPNVDLYLSTKVENETTLPEGLRICAARVARSIYTLRNKRNIAHKNPIDPNTIDLALAHNSAAWIVAELLRNASGVTMQEAGRLIDLIRAPVGTLVEEIDGTRLVHAKVPIGSEVLILLHSHYPDRVGTADILTSLRPRTPGAIRKKLKELRDDKKIFGDAQAGYKLTQPGYASVSDLVDRLNS